MHHPPRILGRQDASGCPHPTTTRRSTGSSTRRLFGEQTGDDLDKFSGCRWRPGPGGPVLEACGRWFAGKVLDRFDAGDHVAFLIEPFAAAAAPVHGQLGFQEVRDLCPGHPA